MKVGINTITQKPYWVKVQWVKKSTGWNNEDMRRAREQGMIKYKHTSLDGYMYDLNSIHPLLIKKTAQVETETV